LIFAEEATMRRFLLATGFAAAACALGGPVEAQNKKINQPGYVVIRVLLDDGGGGAPAPDPNNPGAAPPARVVDLTRSVAAVVPYTSIESRVFDKNKQFNGNTNPSWPSFRHKYGDCFYYSDKTFIQFFVVNHLHFEKDVRDAFEKWSLKRSYDNIHDLCTKALMYGMVDEAQKYCDEYYKLPGLLDRSTPTQQYKTLAAA